MPYRDAEQRRACDRQDKGPARTGGGPTPSQTVVPIPFRLKKAADVLALTEEQVVAARRYITVHHSATDTGHEIAYRDAPAVWHAAVRRRKPPRR